MIQQKKMIRFCLIKANKPGSSNFEMKRMFPPSVNIPVIDVIYDEKSGRERTIRYIPGEKSIYADEQTNKEMPKKRSEIIFYDGWKSLDEKEGLLIEYLRKCNFNSGNKNRMPGTTVIFKEFKPEVDAQEIIDREELDVRARASVLNMPLEDLKMYAKSIGLKTDRDVAEIKHDLLVRARKDPKGFLQSLDSKNTKTKYFIAECLDANIIAIDKKSCRVTWVNGGAIFTSAPGVDIIEDLSEFLQNTEDGRKILERMQRVYDKKNLEDINLSDEEIYNKAVEHKIIEKKGKSHYYNGEKISDGAGVIYMKMKENSLFRNELLEKITNFEQAEA